MAEFKNRCKNGHCSTKDSSRVSREESEKLHNDTKYANVDNKNENCVIGLHNWNGVSEMKTEYSNVVSTLLLTTDQQKYKKLKFIIITIFVIVITLIFSFASNNGFRRSNSKLLTDKLTISTLTGGHENETYNKNKDGHENAPHSPFRQPEPWPNGLIPYKISKWFSEKHKKLIFNMMHKIQESSCVLFKNHSLEATYLDIRKDSNFQSCSSTIGYKDAGALNMDLHGVCMTDNDILRELMHVIGFNYEHNRYDRDNFIKIIYSNIRKHEFRKFDGRKMKEPFLDSFPYDFKSVTHYTPYAYAINMTIPTIISLNEEVIKADGLSELDIKKINIFYKCDTDNDTYLKNGLPTLRARDPSVEIKTDGLSEIDKLKINLFYNCSEGNCSRNEFSIDHHDITKRTFLESDVFIGITACLGIILIGGCIGFIYIAYHYKCWSNSKPNSFENTCEVPLHVQSLYNPNYDMFSGIANPLSSLKQIPRTSVTLMKALGRGAFGEVYEGTFCNHQEEGSNISVAVKTVPNEYIMEHTRIDFQLEALIMSKFKHPNVVQLIGVCFETNPLFIVVELLAGGDLKSFLRESRPQLNSPTSLTMSHLVRMATDVVKGCQYLEDNQFIHCDIAARNCLLTTKTDNLIVKIADFGMARDIYKNGYYRKDGDKRVPIRWMPPEALLDGVFTSKTDVWSFGVLLWEIFTMGYMPYPGLRNCEVMQLVNAGGRLEMPKGCPTQLCQVMNECWNSVAAKRPNFSTIRHVLDECIKQQNIYESPISNLLQTEKAILSDISNSTECTMSQ